MCENASFKCYLSELFTDRSLRRVLRRCPAGRPGLAPLPPALSGAACSPASAGSEDTSSALNPTNQTSSLCQQARDRTQNLSSFTVPHRKVLPGRQTGGVKEHRELSGGRQEHTGDFGEQSPRGALPSAAICSGPWASGRPCEARDQRTKPTDWLPHEEAGDAAICL